MIRKPSSGISAFDLLNDMSSAERTLSRLFLRHITLTRAALDEIIRTLPEQKRPSPKSVDAALQTLQKNGWLQKTTANGETEYALKQQ